MFVKRLGFSLAELLLAIGIVSVVVGLTLKDFVFKIDNPKSAASVAHAVEQIEYGCQNIFHKYSENDGASIADALYVITKKEVIPSGTSTDSVFSKKGFEDTIKTYFNCDKVLDSSKSRKGFDFYNPNSSTDTDLSAANGKLINNDTKVFKFRKTDMELYAFPMTVSSSKQENIDENIMMLGIDVNGYNNPPNRYGRDVFVFYLRNDGHVVPYGDSANCKSGSITDGVACSARLVQDGYKINY